MLLSKANELGENGLGRENKVTSPGGFLEVMQVGDQVQFRGYKDLKDGILKQQQFVPKVLNEESVETWLLYM